MNNNSVCSDDGMCIIPLEWNGDFMCSSCMPLPYGNTQPALYVRTYVRDSSNTHVCQCANQADS